MDQLAATQPSALEERLALTGGPWAFTGHPPRGFDQRLFGGQLLAQGVLAAAGTTDDKSWVPNSLHAFFLRPGRAQGELTYTAEPIRNGRTFRTLSVHAEQHGRAIAVLQISLTRDELPEAPFSLPMPDVPDPEGLAPLHVRAGWQPPRPDGVRHPGGPDWQTGPRPLDVRYIDTDDPERPTSRRFWFRTAPMHASGHALRRAVLAYASDRSLLPAIHKARGELGRGLRPVASVDHTMWFHADVRPGEWCLYVQDSPFSTASLGVARGLIYRRDGILAASLAQQGVTLDAA